MGVEPRFTLHAFCFAVQLEVAPSTLHREILPIDLNRNATQHGSEVNPTGTAVGSTGRGGAGSAPHLTLVTRRL